MCPENLNPQSPGHFFLDLGMVKKTLVPTPTWLSSLKVPPRALTRSAMEASPIPRRPPSRSSGRPTSKPWPLSSTRNSTPPSTFLPARVTLVAWACWQTLLRAS